MTEKRQGPTLDDRDFDAIEAAVMETERGRWFLGEFARRNRLGETRLLLEAITRLEQNVGPPRPAEEADTVRAELAAMAENVARAVAGLGPGQDPPSALGGFLSSLGTMEAAATDIHDAAERVAEIAWQLRESGVSGALCGELEKAAADISTACAFGGITAQRARMLADALRAVTERLDALPPGWRPAAAAAPAAPAETALEPAIPPAPKPARARAEPPRQAPPAAEPIRPEQPRPPKPAARSTLIMPVPSLAAIDKLDFRERLKLFT